jgi:hypothetical protein
MNQNGCVVQFRVCLEELSISETKCLQHQWKLSLEYGVAPAGKPSDPTTAHVTVDVKVRATLVLAPLGQYLIPHEASVQSRDLFVIIVRADSEEELSRRIGMGQGIAARHDRSVRQGGRSKPDVQFLGSQAIHHTIPLPDIGDH